MSARESAREPAQSARDTLPAQPARDLHRRGAGAGARKSCNRCRRSRRGPAPAGADPLVLNSIGRANWLDPDFTVGVRDLVARGYFIPGRTSQRGGGRAPAFRVARCRTSSGVRVDWLGWVPLGPKRARQGPAWSRMGLHISRTPIRDSRVIRQGSSGPVGPYRVPTGFRRNPDLARRDPMGLDGSPDCPASVHD